MSTVKEINHAEEQAKAQLESIVEMVASLDRETATLAYVKTLTLAQIEELALEASVIDAEENIANIPHEAMKERILWEIEYSQFEPSGFEFEEESARETIQEDPLSVQIRSGWYAPGAEDVEAEEFEILLCTGGPAVRIVGDLGAHNQPENPRIQYQDWGTPWTEYFPSSEERDALQTYCEQFYYGE